MIIQRFNLHMGKGQLSEWTDHELGPLKVKNLPNHTAFSLLPGVVYGKGTKDLGGIDAAVKPRWLLQKIISGNYGLNPEALVSTARWNGGNPGPEACLGPPPICLYTAFKRQTFRKLQDVRQEDTDAVKAILHYMLELKDLETDWRFK